MRAREPAGRDTLCIVIKEMRTKSPYFIFLMCWGDAGAPNWELRYFRYRFAPEQTQPSHIFLVWVLNLQYERRCLAGMDTSCAGITAMNSGYKNTRFPTTFIHFSTFPRWFLELRSVQQDCNRCVWSDGYIFFLWGFVEQQQLHIVSWRFCGFWCCRLSVALTTL